MSKRLASYIGTLVLLGSIVNFVYYLGRVHTFQAIYFPTDFQQDLLGIRFLTILGSLGLVIGTVVDRIWVKTVAIISILTVLGFYVLWYFEKFKWMQVIGLKEGTSEYLTKLEEIGWFRGGNFWDYMFLFASIALLTWIASTGFRNGLTSRLMR